MDRLLSCQTDRSLIITVHLFSFFCTFSGDNFPPVDWSLDWFIAEWSTVWFPLLSSKCVLFSWRRQDILPFRRCSRLLYHLNTSYTWLFQAEMATCFKEQGVQGRARFIEYLVKYCVEKRWLKNGIYVSGWCQRTHVAFVQ